MKREHATQTTDAKPRKRAAKGGKPPADEPVKEWVIECRLGVKPDWQNHWNYEEREAAENDETMERHEIVEAKDNPKFKLADEIWEKLFSNSHAIDGWGSKPGVLALAIRASITDEKRANGNLPLELDDPIDARIRQTLPTVISSTTDDSLEVFSDTLPGWGELTIYGKFKSFTLDSKDDIIYKHVYSVKIPAKPIDAMDRKKPEPPKEEPASSDQPWQQPLAQIFDSIPAEKNYEDQTIQRELIKHAFINRFVETQGQSLKTEMMRRSREAASYDEKVKFVRWVNSELRRNGLVISSDKTGVGTFAAATGGKNGGGRFQLKSKTKDDDDKFPAFTTSDLAELEDRIRIIEAPPRRESLAERIEKEAEAQAGNHRS